MKKIIYFLILITIILIALYLNYSKPPVFSSQIGGKYDLLNKIQNLEKKENIKIIETENDLTNNEYSYEVYSDYKDFDIKNIEKLEPLCKFNVIYDENDDINFITYSFSLNNKSVISVLEMLVRTTLLDLTDYGYEKVSKYMKFPKDADSIIKYDSRKFISSNKTLMIKYNKNLNNFIFTVN